MLFPLGLIALAAIAAILILAARKPDTFSIVREAHIAASPQTPFALMNDFHRWADWSPFDALDPGMQRSYTGAENGVGAVYAWTSAGKAGQGRMEIVESAAPETVVIDLQFTKPMKARNVAEFRLEPHEGGTRIVWAMRGPQPFAMKVMTLVFNMEAVVGKDFETGLANLKAIAER